MGAIEILDLLLGILIVALVPAEEAFRDLDEVAERGLRPESFLLFELLLCLERVEAAQADAQGRVAAVFQQRSQ
jgi:hypothetical protein